MRSLKTLVFPDRPFEYDGLALSPHWIYRQFNLMGDAVVAFAGPADVPLDHMVDLEDVKKKAPIYSPRMLHFLGEWFIDSLDQGILLQHLFVAESYELLWEEGISDLTRRGNDLYFKSRKLSVSIATRSPVSVLMHLGINIETDNTPIPTSGLREMGVDPFGFAAQVLARFEADWRIWQISRVKVLPR
jgi:uncharacterized protein